MLILSQVRCTMWRRVIEEVATKFKSIYNSLYMDYENSLVVAVIGATGTGKSKLAIELALKLNGEIISADSMQVYKGLDIITNKVSVEERLQVKHHVLDYVDPLKISYTVHNFKSVALPTIKDVLKQGKVPIIVGGTNYYIESLLWKVLIDSNSSDEEVESHHYRSKTSPELYSILQNVDSEMAKIVHPNDRRKILRSLQVYDQVGRPHSDVIEEQKLLKGGSSLGGPLRFKNSCIFWIQCEQEVLDDRLNKRVDEMIKSGLVTELHNFHQMYNQRIMQENGEADYTVGIFQSIGFKEFHDYLLLDDEQRAEHGSQKLIEGIETLQQRTRRYARKQIKWINNRFLRYSDREVPPIFALDGTDLSKWNENVLEPALNTLTSLQKGDKPSISALPIQDEFEHDKEIKTCTLCNKILLGKCQWKEHINSRMHQKLSAKARKLQSLNAEESL